MTEINHSKPKEKILTLVLASCMLLMVFVFLQARLKQPSLLVHNSPQALVPQESSAMSEIATLMQEVGNHPNDHERILKLVQALIHAEEWIPAENFARRACNLAPESFDAHFLLAIILHKKGDYNAVRKSLEKALTLRDDAAARYSLGILYIYFLNQKTEGLAQLQQALQSQNLTPQLKQAITDELAKES
ncbi:MAG: hypothetical protein IK079_02965 [Desulfovibrio sp.]|nr:hypothetical protein [Desulfovibrio sp.]